MSAVSTGGNIALMVIAACNALFFLGTAVFAYLLWSEYKKLQTRTLPILSQVEGTLADVRQVTNDVAARVEVVSTRAERLASDFTTRMDTLTSDLSQRVEVVSARAEHLAGDFTRQMETLTTDVTQRVDGVTENLSGRVNQVSADLTERVEHALNVSELLADRIAERVDTTTSIIEQAIGRPLVGIAGLRTGILRGLEVWRDLARAATPRRREAAPQPQPQIAAQEPEMAAQEQEALRRDLEARREEEARRLIQGTTVPAGG